MEAMVKARQGRPRARPGQTALRHLLLKFPFGQPDLGDFRSNMPQETDLTSGLHPWGVSSLARAILRRRWRD